MPHIDFSDTSLMLGTGKCSGSPGLRQWNNSFGIERNIILCLGAVVTIRCMETAFHLLRVAEYTRILASALGLPAEMVSMLQSASTMHDIGKIAIADSILFKPDRLSNREFEIMKSHTIIGHFILSGSNRTLLKTADTVALQHHECWDGSGYLQGLKGHQIDIRSRITSLADIFDALGSRRVYKAEWPLDKIHLYIREQKGKIFDPDLVDIFFDKQTDFLEVHEQYQDRLLPIRKLELRV